MNTNDPYPTRVSQSETSDETANDAHPQQIGRYRVEKVLGQGAFGLVYLAQDQQLNRQVAIKVPQRKRIARPADAEAYLAEARMVAKLDHPHIVPVYDVGSTDECACFIVSKFIEGSTLAAKIQRGRLSVPAIAELVATVAEALHYAHHKGVVHRDVKPGNILLDTGGQPHVADFGLALKEEEFGKGAMFLGTPAYMSPEQARGEGHRVDGRSDIFSLGVVFYELLVGRRPFKGDALEELLAEITSIEVRPPRQIDDGIPKELERICLKALAKRASERYTTAKDMADDLRHFLAEHTVNKPSVPAGNGAPLPTTVLQTPRPAATADTTALPTSDSRPVKIVPKGLRSFDAHDADFFLDLLPGPRDRDGLPDSIRFWKTRIEEMDPDNTFSVGLIYGPSGCGKSSLVKAGLLPRLCTEVIAVYVEATAEETETRLLNGLRKRCPALPADLGLKETLAALRRGQGLAGGKKVLIVLDQFEQWLHAKKDEEDTELVQALRQCDGARVQAIVMVRDDFWLAVSRFLKELEVRLLEDQNSALVDLFPLHHAEKVLAAFGRAFGVLPEDQPSRHASLQSLVGRLDQLPEQFRELREGVQMTIQVADVDPEMALTRVRKVLEYVIRDVYERRVKEPPGTRPLENLLQRLVKDGHLPDRLDAYANTIRKLGNVGTHSFGEKVTTADVSESLTQLMLILDWYLEVERPEALGQRVARTQPPKSSVSSSSLAGADQKQFLEQAVSGLAQEGKVICVRLALFAEMMKGKPWTTVSLKAVGGTEGVGVTFLEETFSTATAPPEHRYHQRAARGVLKALLPESGTDIKGHMRSHQELLQASGYAGRPRDFQDLIRLLDSEIRLLTPTDPEGKEGDGTSNAPGDRTPIPVTDAGRCGKEHALEKDRWYYAQHQKKVGPVPLVQLLHLLSEGTLQATDMVLQEGVRHWQPLGEVFAQSAAQMPAAPKYYQLTHDYLVPPLREWLTRKQKETRRGRAELRLADRAALWTSKPENRHLPSSWEWVRIRALTHKKTWTPPQRKMMRTASRYHAVRGLLLAVVLALAGWGAYEGHGTFKAHALLDSLLRAETAKVSDIVADMASYRPWLDPLLRDANQEARKQLHSSEAEAKQEARKQLHSSLALLEVDPSQVDYLYERLLGADPQEVPVLRDALALHKDKLVEKLWQVVEQPARGKESQRLRAAAALAKYDPDSKRWAKVQDQVANDFVAVPAVYLASWMESLRPVGETLLTPLGEIFRDGQRRETERTLATDILASYAADQPEQLANLLMNADEKQYGVLYPKLLAHQASGVRLLEGELNKQVPIQTSQVLHLKATMTKDDPAVKIGGLTNVIPVPAKLYPVKVKEGKTYTVTMASTELEGFLVLHDSTGKQLASHYSGGRGKNASLAYTALKNESFKLYAASYKRTGSFSLDVVESDISQEAKEKLAKRQANAAVALLRMNQPDKVWPLLKHSQDPRVRSYLIHRFFPLGAEAGVIVKRLAEEQDVTIKRALILSLGEYGMSALPSGEQTLLVSKMKAVYQTADDPGLHAAAEWLLRTWKQHEWLRQTDNAWKTNNEERAKRRERIQDSLAQPKEKAQPQWYVNGQGQTMVVIPEPGAFDIGSPPTEVGRAGGPEGPNEQQHRKRIGRSFAIAAREVTVAQFLEFKPHHAYDKMYAPTTDCPVNKVTWYDAAAYCNWLSKQEGIDDKKQWCYLPNGEEEYAEGMKLAPDYLQRIGYRLPSEAEWEYACRAEALTSRFYGETEELLGKYAWYTKNALDRGMLPGVPGQFEVRGDTLKPNDFGLFDMLGNALEWCQDPFFLYTRGDDIEHKEDIKSLEYRVLRGGSFYNPAVGVRSASRYGLVPTNRIYNVGFRPARTFR